MDASRLILLELCYLTNKRNQINQKRHQFLGRKNYWENAARAVRWFKSPTGSTKHPYYGECRDIWLKMGLHKIRLNIMENQYKYTRAKCETMEFTIKHRSKMRKLFKDLNAAPEYFNGYINVIGFWLEEKQTEPLFRNNIKALGEEYEAYIAVQKMLKD